MAASLALMAASLTLMAASLALMAAAHRRVLGDHRGVDVIHYERLFVPELLHRSRAAGHHVADGGEEEAHHGGAADLHLEVHVLLGGERVAVGEALVRVRHADARRVASAPGGPGWSQMSAATCARAVCVAFSPQLWLSTGAGEIEASGIGHVIVLAKLAPE